MVIREKALVAQMKEAYKGGGYTVAAMNNGKTVILCDDWAVQIDDAEVPREALSLMCLHFGFLPEDGDAFTVYKEKGKPVVNREDYSNTVREFEMMDDSEVKESHYIHKTVLTYSGCNVWQEAVGNRVHLVNPEYEQILYKIDRIRMVGNSLYAADLVSKVYITFDDSMATESQLECLKKFCWKTVI